MSIKWFVVKKKKNQKITKKPKKTHAKCPESLYQINLKQNTTDVYVP